MNFPDYFADAESTFDQADFIIFGAPYDKTSSFRIGARNAPKEIRQASWNFETYNVQTGVDLRDIKFHDYGDLCIENDKPEKMIEKLYAFSKQVIEKNKFPIAVGGEHSITPGIVKAFTSDIAVLSLDAHIDYRNKYENEKFNHACVIRRISDHIDIKSIAVLGIRSAEKEEFEEANKNGLFYIDSYKISNEGIDKSLGMVKDYFGQKRIYLTLDIDVIDPAYAPGTSTPEPFGLHPIDIIKTIDFFASQLVGFDIVEVCPEYDKGQTSILAAKIIRHLIQSAWSNKN